MGSAVQNTSLSEVQGWLAWTSKLQNRKVARRLAVELFKWQASRVQVYADWCRALKVEPSLVTRIEDIPMLPISFFKSHEVLASGLTPETVFISSGTGGLPSGHPIPSCDDYRRVALAGFERVYGPITDYECYFLLPNYLERSGSSLVMMAEYFAKVAGQSQRFFLYNHERLREALAKATKPVLLLGVTFALSDFIEDGPVQLPLGSVVMYTGGMKGRKTEPIAHEVRAHFEQGFPSTAVHAEYGMTELMSQAYTRIGHSMASLYVAPPWLIPIATEVNDPRTWAEPGATGLLAFIDLANVHSCAFIQTEDLGKVHPDDSFEVLGRMDASEVRGCNLMASGF